MTSQEYFKGWWNIIPQEELRVVINKVNSIDNRLLCPSKSNIFKAFNICPYEKVSVIIIGQDPYFDGSATGIAFGVNGEYIPPSLSVIKEACIDYTKPHYGLKFDNTLESWAKQGVLLLNSALTVELNKPNSHVMIWRKFLSQLLLKLSLYNPGLIYVLLGEQSQTLSPYISKNNDIIECKHPAFYARTHTKMPDIFTKINQITYSKTGESIKWFTQLN